MSDWDDEKDRFRCTTCGERTNSLSALRSHYLKCWRTNLKFHRNDSDAELRRQIEDHLNREAFDIFGGHSYSASKGRVAISEADKTGKLRRYYNMFNPEGLVVPRKRKRRGVKRRGRKTTLKRTKPKRRVKRRRVRGRRS